MRIELTEEEATVLRRLLRDDLSFRKDNLARVEQHRRARRLAEDGALAQWADRQQRQAAVVESILAKLGGG